MANAKNLLQAAKNQKTGATSNQNDGQRQTSIGKRMMENVMAASSDLGSLENLYFNPKEEQFSLDESYEVYPNGQTREVYDAKKEMEQIKNGNFTINKDMTSKLPQAILESIISNPLDMPTDLVDNSSDIMDEALNNRTIDILNKLEARDKQSKVVQQPQQVYVQPVAETVDYNMGSDIDYKKIAQIVEAVVDKKMKQYHQVLLNESKTSGQNTPKVSFLRLGNTLTFMDDANNVYECKMVYKGKGKVKKN